MLYNSVMPFLHIVVLAVVQGLTELLPVSSSAHAAVATIVPAENFVLADEGTMRLPTLIHKPQGVLGRRRVSLVYRFAGSRLILLVSNSFTTRLRPNLPGRLPMIYFRVR